MDTRTALEMVARLRPEDVQVDGDAQAVGVVSEGVGAWWRVRRRGR